MYSVHTQVCHIHFCYTMNQPYCPLFTDKEHTNTGAPRGAQVWSKMYFCCLNTDRPMMRSADGNIYTVCAVLGPPVSSLGAPFKQSKREGPLYQPGVELCTPCYMMLALQNTVHTLSTMQFDNFSPCIWFLLAYKSWESVWKRTARVPFKGHFFQTNVTWMLIKFRIFHQSSLKAQYFLVVQD